ncbi:MAG: isoprenyl transferase [Planctomycetes bacterium]|nr:isoprenyl transferase [Planctomycetota bacterium]NOG54713.1 isoprenyl transferase [Planctomycetota bacterium]
MTGSSPNQDPVDTNRVEQNASASSSAPTPLTPTPHLRLPDVPVERLPHHIAIIMDGNGRWAVERGRPRVVGHENGARSVRAIVTECAHLGIEALTLYSFSLENWQRPKNEVDFLMGLYVEYLIKERREMLDNNIRFYQCGRREGLPEPVLAELDRTTEATAHCTGLNLALALNYGSRAEIADGVRAIAAKVAEGTLAPEQVTEQVVSDHLYLPQLPDPDLLIRTAGEMRISNFLLWQISYAELHVTDVYWPDFSVEHLHAAIRDYAHRDRRFGTVANTSDNPEA